MSAVFDPRGDGASKFFASWGEYYLPIAANTNIRLAGNETYIHTFYDWDGMSVGAQEIPTNLGPVFRTDTFGTGEVPDTRSVTDANMEAMFQEELIVGYNWSTDFGWDFGVKGIQRELGSTIEDVAIDAAVIDYYNNTAPGTWDYLDDGEATTVEEVFSGFHQYVLTNPGNDMRIYIPEQEETITLTAEQLGYPEPKRTYRAIEFTASRLFDGRWGADFSYTWSRSKGNHEGYVKSDNGQDDAGITQNFDQPGLVDHSDGRLPNDRTHTIKVYGSYEFDMGLRLGTNLFWQTGRPINCFGLHPTDTFAQEYGASSHFCNGEPVRRGSLGLTNTITNIDLSVQYPLAVGDSELVLKLDVFNVFNTSDVQEVWEDGETSGGAEDPDFLRPIQYQRPRALRLSARYNF